MPLSAQERLAAHRAKRLLADEIFNDTLNEMTEIETERAILLNDAAMREQSRQIVLAIGRIRGTLQAAVALAETEGETDALAQEMEDRVV